MKKLLIVFFTIAFLAFGAVNVMAEPNGEKNQNVTEQNVEQGGSIDTNNDVSGNQDKNGNKGDDEHGNKPEKPGNKEEKPENKDEKPENKDEKPENKEEGAVEELNIDFKPYRFVENLDKMAIGMAGIFIVMGVVVVITTIFNKVTSTKK